MCKTCGYPYGSNKHLLYWQWDFLKKFCKTWYHIINRKAYRKWFEEYHKNTKQHIIFNTMKNSINQKYDPPEDYYEYLNRKTALELMNEEIMRYK